MSAHPFMLCNKSNAKGKALEHETGQEERVVKWMVTSWCLWNLDHSALLHFMSFCGGTSPEFVYTAAVVPNGVNSCVAMVPSGYIYVNGV